MLIIWILYDIFVAEYFLCEIKTVYLHSELKNISITYQNY